MVFGTIEAWRTPGGGQSHLGSSTAPIWGHVIYIGFAALVLNLVVSAVLTLIFNATKLPAGTDETHPSHYTYDPEDGEAEVVPATASTSTP
jgi:SSS family solute:Na+ symporter